jgi:hypothetical protein
MEEQRRTPTSPLLFRRVERCRAVDLRASDALAGTKNQKHQEGGSDHAHDDEDQSGAGEARSLLRWWSGRFHSRLDAGGGPGDGFGKEEVPHGGGYLFKVGLEGEVACV